jgi:hypothetical protein
VKRVRSVKSEESKYLATLDEALHVAMLMNVQKEKGGRKVMCVYV